MLHFNRMTQPFSPDRLTGSSKVILNNGVEMPVIGCGSYVPNNLEARRKVKDWVCNALKNGYRHVDTAQIYGTERSVGEAIRASGVPREEIFVTTKLAWSHHGRVREALDQSLKNLGVDYVDMYLIHWPQALAYSNGTFFPKYFDGTLVMDPTVTFHSSWAVMEELLAEGKVKAIGVSNFSIKTLEELLTTATVVPAVNQVELHPYLAQNELREYCNKRGILLTAYTATGYDIVRNDPLIREIAAKYKVTPTQVIFSWHLSRGTPILPKSENDKRQKENITIPDISEEDLGKIWHLDKQERLCSKAQPKTNQVWGWTYEQLGWESFRTNAGSRESKL